MLGYNPSVTSSKTVNFHRNSKNWLDNTACATSFVIKFALAIKNHSGNAAQSCFRALFFFILSSTLSFCTLYFARGGMLRTRATLSFRPLALIGSWNFPGPPRRKKYDGAPLHRRFAVGELRFVFDTFHHEFLEGWNQRNSDDQDVSSSDSEDVPFLSPKTRLMSSL